MPLSPAAGRNLRERSGRRRALAMGESLPVIGRLLGHAEIQTPGRYAHLAEDSVREAAALVAASIGEDILPERGGEAKGLS